MADSTKALRYLLLINNSYHCPKFKKSLMHEVSYTNGFVLLSERVNRLTKKFETAIISAYKIM